VFPELFLSGYAIGKAVLQSVAIAKDGPEIQRLRQMCMNYHVGVCTGYPEKHGADYYDSAVFISPEGKILINYRKTHLFSSYETDIFTRVVPLKPAFIDDMFPVVSFTPAPGQQPWRVGVAICYDIEFSDTARLYGVRNVDLVLVPTAVTGANGTDVPLSLQSLPLRTVPTRAYENAMFVVYADHWGDEADQTFIGMSTIGGPWGDNVALSPVQGSDLQIRALSFLNYDDFVNSCWYLSDRRTDLYSLPVAPPQ